MVTLTPQECRVLGVLVEKAQTTPGQYPLSLNAIVAGANQKSNRLPVMSITEDNAIELVDSLRGKGLVREVMLSGSRVAKFRHVARDALDVGTPELVVLAELMLRGPQTVGEMRGRASRMHPLESLEIVSNILEHLAGRESPLVHRLPAPGSRAERWGQLLCPQAHPLEAPAVDASAGSATTPAPAPPPATGTVELEARVTALESEVARLREKLALLEAVIS